METFSALLALCAGNSPVSGEFLAQRTATRSFDVFFDLHLNKRLSKQSWGWWFQTLSSPLWRHCNEPLPTSPVKLTRHCLTRWISKLLGSFEIHWERQYIPYRVLLGLKGMMIYEMTVKLKSYLYVGPVTIFPNFWHRNMVKMSYCLMDTLIGSRWLLQKA